MPLGDAVSPVNLTPATARVTIPVFTDLRSQEPAGQPGHHRHAGAPASRSRRVTVEPTVVTVEGDAEQLADLVQVDTSPSR